MPDLGTGGGDILDLLLLVIYLLYLAVAFPLWLWYLGQWLYVLAIGPYVGSQRKQGLRPTTVVARRVFSGVDDYTREVQGFTVAEGLVAHVAREIEFYGVPRSLTERPRRRGKVEATAAVTRSGA